ncbi:MAG TPA: thioredoxin family protein, partial [Aquabacterium sp.]|uniref:cytochrome c biogenesis protein CcdA n=1 Tax=Aquabacterium sp. TaxID=1872578 RepID=UPI002E31C9EF
HPWVVLVFAALMVLLALSMFGLYELQLPASVQSWLGAGSNKLPGGKFISVFAMGVVSALVVSPCVSAPLAGALLYISQTHDVVLGGAALYAMAWGMSVPLLLVGLSAGSLLPRTGPWMKAVKALFGVLMLGMAVWVARPAWPYLQSLAGAAPAASVRHSALPFERVRTVAELDAALAQAKTQGKPVMLDFYADWCTSCLEMEHETFSDPQVQARLRGAVLLQADVTVNTADDRALLQRFKLFGPPGIIFFDAQGQERTAAQVVGFQKPQDFLRSLQQAGL